jgi:hypothetical protein
LEYRIKAGIQQPKLDLENIPETEKQRIIDMDDSVLLDVWEDTQERYQHLKKKDAEQL